MKKIKVLSVFLLIVFSIVIGGKASALSGKTYMDKAYLEGVNTCWTGHLKSPMSTGDFPPFLTVMPDRIFSGDHDGMVLLPTDLTGIYDDDLRCIELIAGYGPAMQGGEFKGLLKMAGLTEPGQNASDNEKTQFMKNIGYSTKKIAKNDGKCVSINFERIKDGSSSRSGTLCLTNLEGNSKITNKTKVELADDAHGNNFTFQDSIDFKEVDGGSGVEVSYTWYHENCQQTNIGKTCSGMIDSPVKKTFKVADYGTFEGFRDAIGTQFAETPPSICAGGYAQQRVCFEYKIAYGSPYNYSSTDDTLVQYVLDNKTNAANAAIKYFSAGNLKNWSDLKYTNPEKVLLYQEYLTEVFKVSFADDSCPDVDASQVTLLESSGYMKVKWNGKKTCYIKASNTNKEVVGIETDGSKKDHFGKKMKFSDLVDVLNSTTLTDEEMEELETTASEAGGDGEVEPTCVNSGGAASLGWIVCPILDWMQDAAKNTYNNYVKPNLVVQPTLFQGQSGGDETRNAWAIFQGFANTCFIILFLVVIFSQLTGYGIDNYGIKKLLPKMIVVAVLVNLSYLICVLCVDLSNILGNGFQALFEGLSVGGSVKIGSQEFDGSGAGATVITAVALVSALFLVGKAVWQNPAILLTLLVSALGVLIAIFFLFILLAGRKAAIVVLTVVSPLAFVSYMLPNLKRQFFDKWLKFWEGLLLVYPICGLLIGGGDFVSRLLLITLANGDGFLGAFTAMIVGIIPVFMIPTVLKGAFAAMGTIGSKITGFGDRMRGSATRGMRNSEAYKSMQERGRETGIRRKAGYDKNGNKKNLNGFQRFVRGGSRNVQRNALAYQKLQAEKGALKATEGADYMLATETANEAKRIASSGEINTIGGVGKGGLTDGLYNALMSGDRAKINAYSDALSAKGEKGREAVKDAYNRAVANNVSGAAAKTLADNIMANHAADYKNNNRSMFDVAQGINNGSGSAMSTDSYVAAHRSDLAGKVTASTIGTMDDDAFDEMFGTRGEDGKMKYGVPDGADKATIGEIAYKAMSTQNAGIKSDRMTKLKAVIEASGYSGPDAQDVRVTNMPTLGAAEEGETFSVRTVSSGTSPDTTTDPGVVNNDPTGTTAE